MSRTLLDLSDVVQSREYTQMITIIRHTGGEWIEGDYIEKEEELTIRGVVSAADAKEINMIPEGDRTSETKVIHSVSRIYTTRLGTRENSESGTSDIIIWNGNKYKVMSVQDTSDYGYWRATIVKIEAY